MRRHSMTLLVVLLVLALGLGAVACGGSSTSSLSPQELLTASVDASKAATSQSGTYEITLNVNTDASQMAADEQVIGQLLAQPININGAFAAQEDPARADVSVGLALMGVNLTAGVRALDDNAWVSVLDQWYEVPAESLQQAGGSGSADIAKTLTDAMDEQGIDVNTWCKDLSVVGEETLTDTAVTHLKGKVDVQKMAADIMALLQSPKIQALMASEGAAASADTGVTIPDAAALEEAKATIEQMIKSATMDIWVAKSDSSMRKALINADVVIPQEMGLTGLTGAKVAFAVNLDAPNTAVNVKAPASAKPFAQLQTDLQSNPLFSSFLSGFLGSGSGSPLGQ